MFKSLRGGPGFPTIKMQPTARASPAITRIGEPDVNKTAATMAKIRLRVAPTSRVPSKPAAGSSQNPVAAEPTMDPNVFQA